jgi:hypothetical protein
VHRAALVTKSEKPNARRIDYMLSVLQKHSPQEIATFYNLATDDERLVMEAASASVGRISMKTDRGLEWQPLLDPDTVNDSITARVTATNPEGAVRLQELTEIRAMHVTVAGHALHEIQNAVPGVMPEPELTIQTR